MQSFPDDYPMDAAQMLADYYLQDNYQNMEDLQLAAWNLLGYGIKQASLDQCNFSAALPAVEAARQLKSGSKAGIDWTVMVPTVVTMIQQLQGLFRSRSPQKQTNQVAANQPSPPTGFAHPGHRVDKKNT